MSKKIDVTIDEFKNAKFILEKSPVVAFLWHNKKNWPVEFVTSNIKKLFGYTASEFLSGEIQYSKIIHKDDLHRVMGEVKKNSAIKNKKEFNHSPYRIITKNNRTRWVEDKTFIRRNKKGEITHYQGVVWDVTETIETKNKIRETNKNLEILVQERTKNILKTSQKLEKTLLELKQQESDLRDKDEKIKTLLKNIPGMVYRANADWSAEFYSYTKEISGYSAKELNYLPGNWYGIILEEDKEKLNKDSELLSSKPTTLIQIYRIINKKKKIIWVEDHKTSNFDKNNNYLGVDGIVFDITERIKSEKALEQANLNLKETTTQLVQSAKMAALGELTAGVAHELNQPLNGIKIISQVILQNIKKDQLDLSLLNDKLLNIVQEVNKMAEIIQHMRIFTRKTDEAEFSTCNLNEIIINAFKFIEQQFINNNIDIKKDLSSDTLYISGDAIRIEQVLLNFFSNARYALVQSNQEDKVFTVKLKREKNNAVILIKDNGVGMNNEIMDKIFHPFFTTKEVGEGTGLGLSISQKIIHEHNGKITVESKKDKYTLFQITFPLDE